MTGSAVCSVFYCVWYMIYCHIGTQRRFSGTMCTAYYYVPLCFFQFPVLKPMAVRWIKHAISPFYEGKKKRFTATHRLRQYPLFRILKKKKYRIFSILVYKYKILRAHWFDEWPKGFVKKARTSFDRFVLFSAPLRECNNLYYRPVSSEIPMYVVFFLRKIKKRPI